MERNDSDKKAVSDSGPDPSAPITRKGVLTSFLTGKAMEIPEQDIVINSILFYLPLNLSLKILFDIHDARFYLCFTAWQMQVRLRV